MSYFHCARLRKFSNSFLFDNETRKNESGIYRLLLQDRLFGKSLSSFFFSARRWHTHRLGHVQSARKREKEIDWNTTAVTRRLTQIFQSYKLLSSIFLFVRKLVVSSSIDARCRWRYKTLFAYLSRFTAFTHVCVYNMRVQVTWVYYMLFWFRRNFRWLNCLN